MRITFEGSGSRVEVGRRTFLSAIAALLPVEVAYGQATAATHRTDNGSNLLGPEEGWSRFRGPNGSGIGTGTGYPIEFGPNKNLIWKRPFPRGRSSPVLTTDRIFLTADEDDRLHVISVDRASGKTVWQRSLAPARSEYKNPLNDGASPSAATDGTNVYAFFGDYGLISYDGNGNERWRTPLGPFSSFWGMATSPVVAGEAVVLLLDGFSGSSIAGFNRNSGHKTWEDERLPFAFNYSTPIVRAGTGNQPEVLALGSNDLVSYDAKSGERRWSVPVQRGNVVASPVLIDNSTVVALIFTAEEIPPFPDKDGDGIVTETDIPTDPKEWMSARVLRMISKEAGDRDGKITRAEWNTFWSGYRGKPSVTAINIGTPGQKAPVRGTRWSYTRGVARVATPLVNEGILYYVNMGGILTALDVNSGVALKVGRLEGALDNYYASPVAAEGRLYFTSEAGKIVVVRAGANWSILANNNLNEPCYSTPALSNGNIFVRTAESLACFGRNDGPN